MFRHIPRCGTLLQYGRADVIRIFCSPSFGSLEKGVLQTDEQDRKLANSHQLARIRYGSKQAFGVPNTLRHGEVRGENFTIVDWPLGGGYRY